MSSRSRIFTVTALKAGAADYLVKDTLGDFIPLLHVAVDGALRQAMVRIAEAYERLALHKAEMADRERERLARRKPPSF